MDGIQMIVYWKNLLLAVKYTDSDTPLFYEQTSERWHSLLIRIIVLLIVFTPLYSQSLSRLGNISTADGLPSNVVKDIAQDHHGFMWFATQSGLSRFDGYNLESIQLDEATELSDVTSLLVASDDTLWIGTKNKGLFFRQQGIIKHFPLNSSPSTKKMSITSITQQPLGDIWVGTKDGLFKIDNDTKTVSAVDDFNHEIVVSIALADKQNLWVATKDAVYQYNDQTKKEVVIRSEKPNKNRIVYIDHDKKIWLGKDRGLFQFNSQCHCFELFDERFKNTKIHSLVANQKNLWIGSLYDGLYQYSYDSKTIQHYQYDERHNVGQLADTNMVSLHVDDNDVLWIGTFRGGINHFNLSSMDFGLTNYDHDLMYCAKSLVIYDLFEQSHLLWVATEKGLVKLNHSTETCDLYQITQEFTNSVRSVYIDSSDRFWVGASKTLYQFDPINGQFKTTNTDAIDSSIILLIEYENNQLLLGSVNGLYAYDIDQDTISKIESVNPEHSSLRFNNYSVNQSGQYIFATHSGLFVLTEDMKLKQLMDDSAIHKDSLISTLLADENGGLWLGTGSKYLLYLNKDGKVENRTKAIIDQDIQIHDIVRHNGELWISSNMGMFRYDLLSQKVTHYDVYDGLQDNEFVISSSHQSPAGKIYFGGKNGFNAFFPDHIPKKDAPPNSMFSAIRLNGRQLTVGNKTNADYLIDKNINDMSHLVLNHKDSKIDIEFSTSDYSDPNQNKFAYRLLGFNDDWEVTSAKNRHAIYTNLNAGEYDFQLKSANKYGVWSTDIKQLSLTILPAPWLSLWAYVFYFVVVLFSIWGYVHYKAISARKKAKELEATIVARTNEVNTQKQKVETLLQQKNEIFANITHEFKTPLTLITGPLEQLAQEIDWARHTDMIKMVQRNSQRLMLLVSQILKLSEAELQKDSHKESQAIHPTLTMLYEAFKPIADSKDIRLLMDNNVHANICATAECLEVVVGNLLSNAFKFTPLGGEIKIISGLKGNHVSVSVIDTGSGIKMDDIDKIFNRFVRLDAHKNTHGTGIGLSVVKEITQANDGSVSVESEWGAGSTFTVTFPMTEIRPNINRSDQMLKQLVQNTASEIIPENKKTHPSQTFSGNNISILIIEDNKDMQTHIGNVLAERFDCLFASRGKEGIALALEELPDIIICDVMMPGLDGYKVTRILRNDSRTSHIPIVLLTALNTKESRIKGWRENIDIYIAKPFDALELNAQLDSILIIRKILQQQTNKLIKTNGSLSALNLPQQDLKFIDKLKDVISKNYANSHFQKADLASKMAISERLLHRKVKALIDESPLKMLRDYRLEKAAIGLKNGYQVSIISEECGFNSVPYFCRCFRENYGVSPKKYQTLHRNTGSSK